MRWCHRAALMLVLAAMLPACTSVPQPSAQPAVRAQFTSFSLEGRVSVRDGERAEAIGIYWTHAPGADRVEFTTPMGQILARLDITPGAAVLLTSGGEARRADSADLLAEQALGLKVPVSRLMSWVEAVPGERARVLRRDAAGRPGLISEDGWLVEYIAYAGPLPDAPVRRIEANWGDLRVSLLVDEWQAQ